MYSRATKAIPLCCNRYITVGAKEYTMLIMCYTINLCGTAGIKNNNMGEIIPSSNNQCVIPSLSSFFHYTIHHLDAISLMQWMHIYELLPTELANIVMVYLSERCSQHCLELGKYTGTCIRLPYCRVLQSFKS